MKKSFLNVCLKFLLVSAFYSLALAGGNPEWKIQNQIQLPAKASVLAYSSDGARLAAGHADGRVSVWNTKSGEQVCLLAAHTKEVHSVQFYLQDSRLITMGKDQRARIWNTTDWKEVGAIEGVAFSGAVSPDGRLLAAQAPNQVLWLWDVSTYKPVKQLTEQGKGGTKTMSFSANGKYIATAYSTPLVIDIETGQMVSFVRSGDKKTAVKIEQGAGNQASISLGAMQEDDAPTHRVIPSRTGTFLALGRGWYGQPTFIDLWDTSSMKRLERIKLKDTGTLTSFSFDNSLLAIEGKEKVIIVKVANGKSIGEVKGSGIMQFSPKTLELAVTDNTTLSIYNSK
jgi:WD40 repeat protein